tara:strand:- start:172 stop:330 length:159 start_codon:yes stop_codon:yes gene_type:complete
MIPITQRVHSRREAATAVCPTCNEEYGKGCGRRGKSPIMKYNHPVMKLSSKR